MVAYVHDCSMIEDLLHDSCLNVSIQPARLWAIDTMHAIESNDERKSR